MKYVILVPDGAADYPLKELGGKTPLEFAKTPYMDELAKRGSQGLALTIPQGFSPGSDVANLGIVGYDPQKYYTGRGPLEAAYQGIELKEGQWAFRCNLVTVDSQNMVDYSAGHITTEEAKLLIEIIQDKLGKDFQNFFPGVSYRHTAVLNGDFTGVNCTPPHDICGQPFLDYLPKGANSRLLKKAILDSQELLKDHSLNIDRIAKGKNPANSIWLWGGGQQKDFPSFKAAFGINAAMISAVDLLKGIAVKAKMKVIEVPGATGYFDTNYAAKANYGLKALEKNDLVFIHVEAPDEAGHVGDLEQKIKAIENFDEKIVSAYMDKKVLLLPDHPTPLSIKTHSTDPVPFILSGPGVKADSTCSFSEMQAAKGGLGKRKSHELIKLLLDG